MSAETPPAGGHHDRAARLDGPEARREQVLVGAGRAAPAVALREHDEQVCAAVCEAPHVVAEERLEAEQRRHARAADREDGPLRAQRRAGASATGHAPHLVVAQRARVRQHEQRRGRLAAVGARRRAGDEGDVARAAPRLEPPDRGRLALGRAHVGQRALRPHEQARHAAAGGRRGALRRQAHEARLRGARLRGARRVGRAPAPDQAVRELGEQVHARGPVVVPRGRREPGLHDADARVRGRRLGPRRARGAVDGRQRHEHREQRDRDAALADPPPPTRPWPATAGSAANATPLSSSTHSDTSSVPPRSAVWMNGSASACVCASSSHGTPTGPPTSANSGRDDAEHERGQPGDEPEPPPHHAGRRERRRERQRREQQPQPARERERRLAVEQQPEARARAQRERERVRLARARLPGPVLGPPHEQRHQPDPRQRVEARPAESSSRCRSRRRATSRTPAAAGAFSERKAGWAFGSRRCPSRIDRPALRLNLAARRLEQIAESRRANARVTGSEAESGERRGKGPLRDRSDSSANALSSNTKSGWSATVRRSAEPQPPGGGRLPCNRGEVLRCDHRGASLAAEEPPPARALETTCRWSRRIEEIPGQDPG